MVAVAGLVPCAESGIRIFLRGLPCDSQQRADQQDARELAMRAGGRLQRDRVHAGDLGQHPSRAPPSSPGALRERFGLIGMRPRQALDARHLLIDARVVLHGAGAERIEAEVDRVILRGEAREVANGVHFAHFRKVLDFVARISGAERGSRIDGRHIQRRKLIAASCRASCARTAAARSVLCADGLS